MELDELDQSVRQYLLQLLKDNERLLAQNTELQTRMSEMAIERQSCGGLQDRVGKWVEKTLGYESSGNPHERGLRFLEEALELAQVAGVTIDQAYRLANHVLGREPGRPEEEVAGSMVTLCALAKCLGVEVLKVATKEIARLETPEVSERIRRRQDEKRALLLTADKPVACKDSGSSQ